MEEEKLLRKGYKKYVGTNLNVYFNREYCYHSGLCTDGNNEVFDIRRKPWILVDKASIDDVKKVIDTCPSGALKYLEKK